MEKNDDCRIPGRCSRLRSYCGPLSLRSPAGPPCRSSSDHACTPEERIAIGRSRHVVGQRLVPADQVRAHRGSFLGKSFTLVRGVCLVLAVVHEDRASVTRATGVGLVKRVGPAAAATEAGKVLDIVHCGGMKRLLE